MLSDQEIAESVELQNRLRDWIYEVKSEATRLGFDEWLVRTLESEEV